MNIFQFDRSRDYIVKRIELMPQGGRGELRRMADAAGMHSPALSRVLKGRGRFTIEQAFSVSKFLGLDPLETEYMIELVNLERADSEAFRKFTQSQLERIRKDARQEPRSSAATHPLPEPDRATFYSNWYYSAAHLLTTLPEYQTLDAISARLGLPRDLAAKVVDFLLTTGLCIDDHGRLAIGQRRTHVSKGSPLLSRHHMNWRMKGMEKMGRESDDEYFYTVQMAVGASDVPKIKALLLDLVKKTNSIIDAAESEVVVCLNLDWFRL